MIPFNKPPVTGNEIQYINAALENGKLSGDGPFGKQCQKWFENKLGCKHALLTPSCTAALEIAALLVDIQPGDEVIMPSYTFVSTANAFVLRGAKIKFVDIHPETMNMDAALVAAAITDKPKPSCPCITPASPAIWMRSCAWPISITCWWSKTPRRAS